MQPATELAISNENYLKDFSMMAKRWGPPVVTQKKELLEFIGAARPGDIFKKYKPLPFGS